MYTAFVRFRSVTSADHGHTGCVNAVDMTLDIGNTMRHLSHECHWPVCMLVHHVKEVDSTTISVTLSLRRMSILNLTCTSSQCSRRHSSLNGIGEISCGIHREEASQDGGFSELKRANRRRIQRRISAFTGILGLFFAVNGAARGFPRHLAAQ